MGLPHTAGPQGTSQAPPNPTLRSLCSPALRGPTPREEAWTSGLTSSRWAPDNKGHTGQSWVAQVCREGSPRSWESSPEANPKGLSRKRGLVGSGESSVCPQLPSLSPASHSLGVTGK